MESLSSPEVDEAWENLHNVLPFGITTEDVRRVGKDPSLTSRIPESWGHGKDKHFAPARGFP